MKIQIDIKSAVAGLIFGIGAMLAVAAADDNGDNGRFQVSAGNGVVCIVNTQTGQAYLWKETPALNDLPGNTIFLGPKP